MNDVYVTFDEKAGRFWQGIPARDMSQDEWNEIPVETQKALLDSGVYKLAKQSKKKESE